MIDFITSNEFWAILFKCLITAAVTAGIAMLCTLLGKIVAKFKNSRLITHARLAVRAAEQKFPNEGKKMGPEKMAYVMDYLAITFPKIKSNQYLYNIAEAAVYELNNESIKIEAEKAFEEKYGELPDALVIEQVEEDSIIPTEPVEEPAIDTKTTTSSTSDELGFNLKSF